MLKKHYKRVFTMYPAWSYQKEVQELNRQSDKGWQLIRGGHFSHRYKKNADVRYRYQLDYPGKIEDMGRYIETYREQGWEFINSTFNSWNYFRKPYDPSASEEQYEIFTDQSSLREMLGRWIKTTVFLTIVVAVFLAGYAISLVFRPILPNLVGFLAFLVQTLLLCGGIYRMKNPSKESSLTLDRAIFLGFFVTILAGVGISTYLRVCRPLFAMNCEAEYMGAIPAELEQSMVWCDFDIPYADNYYGSLNISTESPLCFTIVDETGETLYTVTEASLDEIKLKFHLEKGNYRVYFSDYPGGWLYVRFQLN